MTDEQRVALEAIQDAKKAVFEAKISLDYITKLQADALERVQNFEKILTRLENVFRKI